MLVDSDDLSRAVLLYLGYGRASSPQRDVRRLVAEFGEHKGAAITSRVAAVLAELAGIDVDWATHSLVSGGELARSTMHARYPELAEAALNALAWKFMFDWR
jgi:hypothetical protein